MINLPSHRLPALAGWFPTGAPGPSALTGHALATQAGRWWVDRVVQPRVIAAECGHHVLLRGDPQALAPKDLARFADRHIEASGRFLPLIRTAFDHVSPRQRMVHVRRSAAPVIRPPRGVTVPGPRIRYLALDCVNALCSDIAARRHTPSWTCSTTNRPGRLLAWTAGFRPKIEYTHYVVGAPAAKRAAAGRAAILTGRTPSTAVRRAGSTSAAGAPTSSTPGRCPSPLIDRLVLVSPGGLGRLRLAPGLLAVSAAWFIRPTPARSARLLRAMLAPGSRPRADLVEWMTLVARHCRSSGAPGTAELPSRTVPRLVATGAHDTFLPPRRLYPVVQATLDTELHVIPDAGHLVVEEHPGQVAALV
ncbi:alpha/beta fold hydrolase [Streptomyces lavendulae]|uniref:alpha/beta fold hydrolase n=1 Tax=Streptomyces lavendulae TaxID=1914 RepID=UPI00371E5113